MDQCNYSELKFCWVPAIARNDKILDLIFKINKKHLSLALDDYSYSELEILLINEK